jgi:hypothetical protein
VPGANGELSGGTWEMRVEPDGSGGSWIHVVSHRHPKGRDRIAAVFMTIGGKRFLTKSLEKRLAIVEQRSGTGQASIAT